MICSFVANSMHWHVDSLSTWVAQDASQEDHFSGRNIFFFAIYMEKFIALFTSLYYICFIVCSLNKYEDYKTYVT
jgi:hypothetical protein